MGFRASFPKITIISGLGVSQIIAFGSSLYLLAILAEPISRSTGWTLSWIVGAMSIGLLASAVIYPWIGVQITHKGGKGVLVGSSVSFAVGLVLIGLSETYLIYVLGWIVMGLGMASGLYDAVFSSLGKIFGREARPLISAVAIFGGLASTVFWIIGGILLEKIGWRGVCFAYAAIHLVINIPIYLMVLPSRSASRSFEKTGPKRKMSLRDLMNPKFLLVAALFMIEVLVASVMGVHLINLLTGMGRSLSSAIAIGALFGPAQIAGRILEMTVGHRIQPITATIVALCAIILGLVIMALAPTATVGAMIVYGSGMGVLSVARGTLPLSIFDTKDYSLVIGQLARPITITQAAAPTLGALSMGYFSPASTLLSVAFVCVLALIVSVLLKKLCAKVEAV